MNFKNKAVNCAPGLTLMLSVLKRCFWVPLAYTILNIVIISTSVSRSRFRVGVEYKLSDVLSRLDNDIILFILALAISALVGCTVFSYLGRVSSASFMHGLPVRREKLFFSHFAAGAVMILAPALISAVYIGFYVSKPLYGLLYFLVCSVYSLGTYSFSVMICQLSANTLGGLIFAGFGLFSPLIIEGFVMYLMNTRLYGYNGTYEFGLCRYLYLQPSFVISPYGLIYVFAIIAFVLVGLLLFKKRSIELSGDLIAFPAIRKLATFVCGVLAGMCAYLIFGGNLFMFLLFGVLCAVLVNFAIRKKFTVKGSVAPALSVVLCSAAIFCIFFFDLTGFERRIPALDSIESVRVYDRYYDDTYYTYEGKTIRYMDLFEPVTDSADIEKVRELHSELIGNKNYYSSESMKNFTIEYILKNGKKLSREYRVYAAKNKEAFEPVLALRETKIYRHEILSENVRATAADVHGVYGNTMHFTDEDAERLRSAICYDILNTDYEKNQDLYSFAGYYDTYIYFTYYNTTGVYEDGESVPLSVLAGNSVTKREYIYPYYTETMKVLRELGAESLFDFDAEITENASLTIDGFKYSDVPENAINENFYVEITDTQAIKEILKEAYKLVEVPYDSEKKVEYYINLNIGDKYFTEVRVYVENEVLEKYLSGAVPTKISGNGYTRELTSFPQETVSVTVRSY